MDLEIRQGNKFHKLNLTIALAMAAGTSNAAFVQISEHSVKGLGNAFAGGAARTSNASTAWYNPAGLPGLAERQLIVGAHYVVSSSSFADAGSTTVLTTPLSGGNGGDPPENALIPNLFYSQQLNDHVAFGLGISAPFGVTGEYESDWVGRYHAIKSQITTININPSLGYKINDRLSIGAGINYQRIESELSQAVDFGTICAATQDAATCAGLGLTPQGNDGIAIIKADDNSYGYNLGALWQADDMTRVGFSYRSKIDYTLKGSNDITTPDTGAALLASNPALNLIDSGASASITMPEMISVGVHHQLDNEWAVMGDITRTRWSRIPELRIEFDSGAADSVLTLELEDADRYSLGVDYTPNGKWSYRAGIALDDSPTPNASVRTPRIPDSDRTWLALGASLKYSENLSYNFGYAHLRFDDAAINKSVADSENTFRGNLIGNYETQINILSIQADWRF